MTDLVGQLKHFVACDTLALAQLDEMRCYSASNFAAHVILEFAKRAPHARATEPPCPDCPNQAVSAAQTARRKAESYQMPPPEAALSVIQDMDLDHRAATNGEPAPALTTDGSPESPPEDLAALTQLALRCFRLMVEHVYMEKFRKLVVKFFGVPMWFVRESCVQFCLRQTPAAAALAQKIAGAYKTVDAEPVDSSEVFALCHASAGNEGANKLQWRLARRLFVDGILPCILNVEDESDVQMRRLDIADEAFDLLESLLWKSTTRTTLLPVLDMYQVVARVAYNPVLQRFSGTFVQRFKASCAFDRVLDSKSTDKSFERVKRCGDLVRLAYSLREDPRLESGELSRPLWRQLAQSAAYELAESLGTKLNTLASLEDLKIICSQFLTTEMVEYLSGYGQDPKQTLTDVVLFHHEVGTSDWLERMEKSTILMPNETLVWANDDNTGSLPQLPMQYLNTHDLILRSFALYHSEVNFAVRQDLEFTLWQLRPSMSLKARDLFPSATTSVVEPLRDDADYTNEYRGIKGRHSAQQSRNDLCGFDGSSPYGCALVSCNFISADDTSVRASVVIDLSLMSSKHRASWLEEVAPGQMLYLLCAGGVEGEPEIPYPGTLTALDFVMLYHVVALRGCQIVSIVSDDQTDENALMVVDSQTTIELPTERKERSKPSGQETIQKYIVELDAIQYKTDMERISRGELSDMLYSHLNICIRRKPETSSYISHLKCMRRLLLDCPNLEGMVPPSMKRALLGYFPKARTVDFGPAEMEAEEDESIRVVAELTNSTLDAMLEKSRPGFAYTARQKLAIANSLVPGLTVVVGPPGTGKTDVAVQIVSLLHDTKQSERTLLIARSNNALNDFFIKIKNFGVDERHLIRLGMGESDLRDNNMIGEKSFSTEGRVEHIENQKAYHLSAIRRIAEKLGVPLELSEDCCGALKLRDFYVEPRLDLYERFCEDATRELAASFTVRQLTESEAWKRISTPSPVVADLLLQAVRATITKQTARLQVAPEEPPTKVDAPVAEEINGEDHPMPEIVRQLQEDQRRAAQMQQQQVDEETKTEPPLTEEQLMDTIVGYSAWELIWPAVDFFEDEDLDEAVPVALERFTRVREMVKERFDWIAECMPFEMLRSAREKTQYMTCVHAKVVAMTSTRALSTLEMLHKQGFHYNTLVIEESAQLYEFESYLSAYLQTVEGGKPSPLKRIVLLGDHMQLGPIVQHTLLATRCGLNRSLFKRLVEMKYPRVIWLNEQGRSRSELANVWRDRYEDLGDMPHVRTLLDADSSVIRVGGRALGFVDVVEGEEHSPLPHHYVNSAEAGVVASLVTWLLEQGCETRKVTVLVAYAAQKEVIRRRVPVRVATIDEYQGQQNDYVVLSLVRTRQCGYLNDARRMTVALSRARLGLFVVGRYALFAKSAEVGSLVRRVPATNLPRADAGRCIL